MASSRTLPEELFGVVWARRLRVGVPAAAVLLFVTGCAVFALWSQTAGKVLLAGVFIGLLWLFLRRGDPEAALRTLRRLRPLLIALAVVLVVGGWVVFAAIDQDLGLLLVLLGGLALAVNLFGVKGDPMASPMDGPFYGDTPPYGD